MTGRGVQREDGGAGVCERGSRDRWERERGLTAEITKSIANQQGVGGGLFTPDQSFINLTKKGLLTFYPYWFVVECF